MVNRTAVYHIEVVLFFPYSGYRQSVWFKDSDEVDAPLTRFSYDAMLVMVNRQLERPECVGVTVKQAAD